MTIDLANGNDTPYVAVIADLDSVLTRMTSLHERAWQQAVNAWLQERNYRLGEENAELSHGEYRSYLDGKMRYQGAADFLAARHLSLPAGNVDDPPQADTVCGLGNRKERALVQLLESEGVAVFEDALAALRRWRLSGLKLAAISASCNCRNVLRLIELENYLDVIVDGELARERGLTGKADLLQEAAQQLDVPPSRIIVLEDTAEGIRAAVAGGFGQVVGVNRNHHAAELENAGAETVIRRLTDLRFARRLPSALDHLDALVERRPKGSLALFMDFDGSLTPIVEDPRDARLDEDMAQLLSQMQDHCTIAIISGRGREDLQRRVALKRALYAGNHGLDIAWLDAEGDHREKVLSGAQAAVADVDRAEARLREALEGIAGVIVERKRFAVAIHYRKVRSDVGVQQVRRVVDAVLADTRLRKREGKLVLELEPALDWNKGSAVLWLMENAGIDGERDLVFYLGDDETDEDVFAALAGNGIGIRIGEAVSDSLADFHVQEPADVLRLLRRLQERCNRRP